MTITPSGSTSGFTPTYLGVSWGHGHSDSNTYQWSDYLSVGIVRFPFQPTPNWLEDIRNRQAQYGDQYGLDFDGNAVTSLATFNTAVDKLRSWKNTDPDLKSWLLKQPKVDWGAVYYRLEQYDFGNSALLRMYGTIKRVLENTAAKGIPTMVVWNVKCSAFTLTTTDMNNPEFWKQAWTEYMLFYIGGTWLPQFKVKFVELYNEPGLSGGSCATPDFFAMEMRIRSQAFQEGYADYNAKNPSSAVQVIISAPPESSPSRTRNMEVAAAGISSTLSRGTISGYNWQAYDYHQYNVAKGSSNLNGYKNVKGNLSELGLANKDAYLSETNCFSGSQSESAYPGKDVIDFPTTAACAANRLIWLFGNIDLLLLFKLTQTYNPDAKSGVAKNGILWANNDEYPYQVGGTTKTGEAARLIFQKSAGKVPLWYTYLDPNNAYITAYITAKPEWQAYYLYIVNEKASTTESVSINLGSLPGVSPSSYVIVSAVNSTHHGEVAAIRQLNSAKSLSYTQAASTLVRITIPKVPFTKVELISTEDTTVFAGVNVDAKYNIYTTLYAGTSPTWNNDATSVALLKFDTGALTGGLGKTVSAVLRLKMYSTSVTAGTRQILTVFGVDSNSWSESTATWNTLSNILKPLSGYSTTIDRISKNFIRWDAPGLKIVGHLTIEGGTSGRFIQCDVTDYVKNGGRSFLIARMYRYEPRQNGDAAYALAGDVMQGSTQIYSKRASNSANRPRLFVLQQT